MPSNHNIVCDGSPDQIELELIWKGNPEPSQSSGYLRPPLWTIPPNYNKNFHQDRGKNSLDVIGHTHTSAGPCLSPIRLSGGVCGPSRGASQSVLFSLHEPCSNMANHICLCLSPSFNTPTGLSEPFIYSAKKSWHWRKVGFSLWRVTVLCNMSSCRRGLRRGRLFISTFCLFNRAGGGKSYLCEERRPTLMKESSLNLKWGDKLHLRGLIDSSKLQEQLIRVAASNYEPDHFWFIIYSICQIGLYQYFTTKYKHWYTSTLKTVDIVSVLRSS